MPVSSEHVARAALRGFFGDEQGFKDLRSPPRQHAVAAVEADLKRRRSPHVASAYNTLVDALANLDLDEDALVYISEALDSLWKELTPEERVECNLYASSLGASF